MKKLLFYLLTFFTFTGNIFAHEFWLAPQKYSWQSGEKLWLRWQVGENFRGDNWSGSREKALQLRAYSNIYSYDLLPYLGNAKGDSAKLDTIKVAGNFTIVYQGKNSFIQMRADSFNAYLKEDGLTNAIQWREDNHRDTSIGRELYQRSAKTLIRTKSTLRKSDFLKNSFFVIQSGLSLDIVPLDNPYNILQPTKMQFNIYFQGRLLRDGLVRIWHKLNGSTTVKTTQVIKGVVEADIEPNGEWMISLVKTEPLKDNAIADWHSYWGSLTWGY